MSDQPLVRLAEIEIDPDCLDEYDALLEEEIEASIAREPGVLMLYALRVRGQPIQRRLVEVYADEDAYRAHLQSEHFLKYKTGTEKMVRSLRLIETDPLLLRSRLGDLT
ncbi:putative quinol monooxygenase [Neoaquamicrobium sediminum]|uniref:putative quinol monooxygenase n=1 Tax=Neoaquamicrobium sediminum TaxID=1849104 RepID=UPI003BAD783C